MLFIPDAEISEHLEYKKLIEALREIFQSEYTLPVRHHHFYKTSGEDENTLILMPVWRLKTLQRHYWCIKVISPTKPSQIGLELGGLWGHKLALELVSTVSKIKYIRSQKN